MTAALSIRHSKCSVAGNSSQAKNIPDDEGWRFP